MSDHHCKECGKKVEPKTCPACGSKEEVNEYGHKYFECTSRYGNHYKDFDFIQSSQCLRLEMRRLKWRIEALEAAKEAKS